MKHHRILAVLALFGGLHLMPGDARAQPSFDCSGQLTATERTICGDRQLAALDQRMATMFFAKRDGETNRDRARKLAADQSIWRNWRNTCGDDPSCLRRRYEQRIIDLGGRPPAQTTTAEPSDDGVIRRLRNGRYERVYPDGRIEWVSVDGGSQGTEFPDGTGTMMQFSQSAPPSFPSLPSGYTDWGSALENSLLSVVDSLLPPEDRDGYRALHGGLDYSERVFRHIRAISFLLRE